MNIAESAAVEQLLISRGWEKADDVQVADMVIINTCSVRQTAENRIFGRLGWFTGLKALREKKPGAKSKTLDLAAEYVKDEAKPLTLIVMGCMAERLLKSLKKDSKAKKENQFLKKVNSYFNRVERSCNWNPPVVRIKSTCL